MATKTVQLLAFMLAFGSAFAVTCYKCDSSGNKPCNHRPYDSVDCNQDIGGGSALTNWIPKQCAKLVAQDKNGNEYIARGCIPGVAGSCQDVAKTLSIFSSIEDEIKDMNCYPCDSDNCNPASKLTAYTFLGVVLAAFAFLL